MSPFLFHTKRRIVFIRFFFHSPSTDDRKPPTLFPGKQPADLLTDSSETKTGNTHLLCAWNTRKGKDTAFLSRAPSSLCARDSARWFMLMQQREEFRQPRGKSRRHNGASFEVLKSDRSSCSATGQRGHLRQVPSPLCLFLPL